MVCITSCSLAGIFLVSMLYMTFMVDKDYLKHTMLSNLPDNLKDEYQKRVVERRTIYMVGFFGGLIISLFSLYILRSSIKFGSIPSACFLLSLTYIIGTLYYYVTPKMSLFVTLLDKKEDREAWNEIYNYMKKSYMMSMICGVLFVSLLGYGLCK
jgi:hypothetical protein